MNNSRRGKTLEELQPDYEDLASQPKTLTKTRKIKDVLHVAGRSPVEGQEQYDIMFVTTAVEEEEATEHAVSTFGFRVSQPAEYLKGSTGIIKDVAMRAGIDLDKCYYTACCKWLLPRSQQARPPKRIMKWGMPVLEDEIARVEPKIIVCLGKHVFDMLSDEKIKFADAHGCWFWSEKEWFRLRTPSSRFGPQGLTGPVFTPDHDVFTLRGKVRVDALHRLLLQIKTDPQTTKCAGRKK